MSGEAFWLQFEIALRLDPSQENPPMGLDFILNSQPTNITEALEAPSLMFPCCTQPPNAIPNLGPTLVGFSDYGKFGYDARKFENAGA